MKPETRDHRLHRAHRVSRRLLARTQKPRLLVKRSLKHLHAQVVDTTGQVLAAASSISLKDFTGTKTAAAAELGVKLADLITKKKLGPLVLDRRQYRFHGRLKALVETLRGKGIKI